MIVTDYTSKTSDTALAFQLFKAEEGTRLQQESILLDRRQDNTNGCNLSACISREISV